MKHNERNMSSYIANCMHYNINQLFSDQSIIVSADNLDTSDNNIIVRK